MYEVVTCSSVYTAKAKRISVSNVFIVILLIFIKDEAKKRIYTAITQCKTLKREVNL